MAAQPFADNSKIMNFFAEEQWLQWADVLAENEFVVIDNFLTQEMYSIIRTHFIEKLKASDFHKAGIGALGDRIIKQEIRGDFTYWLNKQQDTAVLDVFTLVNELQNAMRRLCFLPIADAEFHYAFYPPGAHYAAHLDQFSARSNRLISIVIYFNENWKIGNGGELKIFKDDDKFELIEPIARRCVIFRSDTVLHQVMPTSNDRYSLTGWLLKNPVGVGFL